jgi:hypothetical protein
MGKIFTDTRSRCYAWALLGNHAHLLLKTGPVPLHTVMARLFTGHAVTFNRRYRRHGQLFQNPYSGHCTIMGQDHYGWQDVDCVLLAFGNARKKARRLYLSSMESRLARGRRPDLAGGGLLRSYGSWEEVRKMGQRVKGDERILGDDAFVQRILSGERRSRRRQAGLTLDSLAQRVSNLYDITLESLCSRSRRSLLVEARSLFCFWAVRLGGFQATHVAAFLDMTPPGIGYAADRGEKIARDKGHSL